MISYLPLRYFSGVQGDTSRQGELFGIKNIFKLHEDTLATKMAVSSCVLHRRIDVNLPQIEKATIMELDWALAHLSSSKSKKSAKSKADDWVYEADSKSGKEEVSPLSTCFTPPNHVSGRLTGAECSSL